MCLLKIDFEARTFSEVAGYLYFSAHSLYLIFGNKKPHPFGFGVLVKGFVHSKKLFTIAL